MDETQILFLILAAAMAMFVWGKWRHDMVALAALLAAVVAGLVPAGQAFSGFAHPAVITIACVLILSRGLQTSCAVDILTRRLLPQNAGPIAAVAAVTALAAVLSAFMNNVGALALMLPAGVQIADRLKTPAGRVLMPMAFGSILGGMTTMIGTPPNLIVSGFRGQAAGDGFAMFDFTPVGLPVAAAGVVFIVLVGWRLVPVRRQTSVEEFQTSAYLTEARVPEKAKAVGMTLGEIETVLEEADAQVVGLVRNEIRVAAPSSYRKIYADDILVIEADPKRLGAALSSLGLKLEEAVGATAREDGDEPEEEDKETPRQKTVQAGEIELVELSVLPGSPLSDRSATDIRLRTRFGINLLAVSREGRRSMARLRTMRLRAGDVLLMQGPLGAVSEFAREFSCVPLAGRALSLPVARRAGLAVAIMAAAVAGAAFGLLPAAVSFAAGVLAAMAFNVVPPRSVYDAVDWPVIVLLAALIPVAGAMQSTGAAQMLAEFALSGPARGSPLFALVFILVVTMFLSDFMNNAATAAVMCPVALGAAAALGVSADPLLMAVAIGASCAFLTPIGHQNNTLILGPGGFHFGDYWRLGLPLEIVIVALSVILIPMVWPF